MGLRAISIGVGDRTDYAVELMVPFRSDSPWSHDQLPFLQISSEAFSDEQADLMLIAESVHLIPPHQFRGGSISLRLSILASSR